jgi:hypothetical protein
MNRTLLSQAQDTGKPSGENTAEFVSTAKILRRCHESYETMGREGLVARVLTFNTPMRGWGYRLLCVGTIAVACAVKWLFGW